MSETLQQKTKDLFAGYNSNNDKTVTEFIDYIFGGSYAGAVATVKKVEQVDSTDGLTIGAAGNKLAFFDETAVTQKTVDDQALTTPTDLPSALVQITYLQSIVSDLRVALGDIGGTLGYGLVHVG